MTFRRSMGLQEREVRCYKAMTVRGLRNVHREGIVHCDLKLNDMLLFPAEEPLMFRGAAPFTSKLTVRTLSV